MTNILHTAFSTAPFVIRMVLILSVIVILSTDALAASSSARDIRPNIILIVADDMGYSDIGCFGGEIKTPHLDRLAAQGLRFTQFYNNAKCSETRAALLTGLYHHQTQNLRKPNHITLAELLKSSGYRTLMSGKWHLASTPPKRGFDRYFGFLNGAINFFTAIDHRTGQNLMRLDDQPYTVPKNFYSTDAFTDFAIRFIDEAITTQEPFFLYLAHNSPHYPLHAWPKDIKKYRNKYKIGWDKLRDQRYARMIKMGIIKKSWSLTPRDKIVPPFSSLSSKQVDEEDHLMAVYAAMVDNLDQNIGRLYSHLKKRKLADNTLTIFFSDNGACPYNATRTPNVAPGPAESYLTYNSEWANASNTPFRLYKQYSHEGGVSTPMILHWPGKVKSPGAITRHHGHLIDIMPTLIEITGARYPMQHAGNTILPLEGVSLLPILDDKPARTTQPIFWEFVGNHAVRLGKWKLVAERSKDYELYDIHADRCELNNLIKQHPERAARMARLYEAWAKRVGAKNHKRCMKVPLSKQKR